VLENLNKTKVTGIKQVDTLQDGIHNLVAGQVGQGGIGQPISDLVSREGINRAERKGKDDKGGYIPGPEAVANAGNTVVGTVAEGGKQAATAAQAGLKSAGGFFGFGGGQKK